MPEFEAPDFTSRINEDLPTEYQPNLSPKEKGELGVKMAAREFEAQGGMIVGKEVSLKFTPNKGGTYIADLVGIKNNKIYIIEAKYGPTAGMTTNQKIYIPKMLSNQKPIFTPIGKNAINIPHFNIGQPYTKGYIMIYRHYFK